MNKIERRLLSTVLVLLLVAWTSLGGVAESGHLETSQITVPKNLTVIGEQAFCDDAAISSVSLPEELETIEGKAFAHCTSLRSVYFPDRTIEIASDAFDGCSGVTFYLYKSNIVNANYARQHGFKVVYRDGINVNTNLQDGLRNMLIDNPITESALAGNEDMNRLILITNGTDLPEELVNYNIQSIVSNGSELYILQFETGDLTSTRDCFDYLQNWEGKVSVEYDRVMKSTINEETASASSVWSGWEEDPMHFAEYNEYLADGHSSGSVKIAVLDSGVSTSIGHVISGKDCVNLSNPNANSDTREHGTAVAGVIVDCCGDNDVRIVPVKVAEANGDILCTKLIMALNYAIEQNVDIINMSFVLGEESSGAKYCVQKAVSQGIKVVAAAGNTADSISTHFPANVSGVISVSGVGPNKLNGSYQLLSDLTKDGTYAAPASDLSVHRPGATRRTVTGTSFAAPQISAAIALMMMDTEHDVNDIDNLCLKVTGTAKGMPDLKKLATKSVNEIRVSIPAALRYRDNQVEYGPFAINYSPENASDPRFEVESLNEDVATVYLEDGGLYIKTIKSGDATIIIRALDEGGVEKRVNIKVYAPVTSIKISGYTEDPLYIGKTLQLSAIVSPNYADNTAVRWNSSNPDIATVDAEGLVTSIAEGTVTITATAADGYGAKGTATIVLTNIPDPIDVGIENAPASLNVGDTVTLRAKVLPEDAPQDVIWRSSNNSIATIDEDGVLTAISKGIVTIIVRPVKGEGLESATIEIIQKPLSVTISGDKELRVSETTQLTATVLPETANNKNVIWKSKNPTVATVNSSGLVTGVSPGSVTITATCEANSNASDTYIMTIKPKNFTITFALAGGTCSTTSITATCDEPVGTLPTPTKDYCDFTGWYLENGTELTRDSAFSTDSPIKATARWKDKAWSAWVNESAVPSNARIVDTKWTYTETTSSTSSSMSGWTPIGNEWIQTGSGSSTYAYFQDGFNTGDGYYTAYHRDAPSAYENATSKRVIDGTATVKYVYWHWMYTVDPANGFTNRAIYYYYTGNNGAPYSMTGNNFGYKYWEAFDSTDNYTYTADMAEGGNGNWGQNDTYYSWYKIGMAGYRSGWWYKTPVYQTNYTDFTKYYKYSRTGESATQPAASSTITNIEKKVKYQLK